jgi:hypothetical protein
MLYYVLVIPGIGFFHAQKIITRAGRKRPGTSWFLDLGPAEVEFGLSNTASVTRLKIQVRLGGVLNALAFRDI